MIAVNAWRGIRLLRWLLWIATVVFYVAFFLNPEIHFNQYRHLLRWSEFWLFVLPIAAAGLGFIELGVREAAGRTRPAFLRNWA